MMKRLLALLLILTLLCPSALAENTPSGRYEAASALMLQGDYDAAAEAFTALSGYSDAPQMAIYCHGLALMAEGDYARAEKAFTQLGSFKDAPVKVITCRGMAYQAGGKALMAAGTQQDYAVAADLLAAAACAFDEIDYLPEVAARAENCRGLAATCRGLAGTLQAITGTLCSPLEMAARMEAGRRLTAEMTLEARRFDDVGETAHGLCEVRRDGLWGVVNVQGQLVVPCAWETIAIDDDMIVAYSGARCAAFTHAGGVILEGEYDSIEKIGQALLVSREERCGVVSPAGETVLACEYESVSLEGAVYLVRRDGKYGIVSLTGEVILACEWTLPRTGRFETHLRLERTDAQGDTVERCVLTDAAEALPEGVRSIEWLSADVPRLRGVRGEQLYCLSTGKTADAPDGAVAFGSGFIVMEDAEAGAFTWYDADLNVQTPPEGAIPAMSAGLWAYLTEDGGWYLTDLQGRKVLEGDDAENVQIEEHDGGFTALTMPVDGLETCFLLDAAGNIVLTTEEVFEVFDGGYVHIGRDGGEWLTDLTTGDCAALPQDHGRAQHFGQGLFMMRVKEGYVLIHTARGQIGDTAFDRVQAVRDLLEGMLTELVMIERDGLCGLVNLAGEEVLPCAFEQVSLYRDGLLAVVKDGKWGLLNLAGEEIVPCRYDGFVSPGESPFIMAYQYEDEDEEVPEGFLRVRSIVYTVFTQEGKEIVRTAHYPGFYGTLVDPRDGFLYNASGEAVYDTAREEMWIDWAAGDGYIFALEDGVLTVYDDVGLCIY